MFDILSYARGPILASAMVLGSAAAAQTAAPQMVPGLDNYSLPTRDPAGPPTPAPLATPTPTLGPPVAPIVIPALHTSEPAPVVPLAPAPTPTGAAKPKRTPRTTPTPVSATPTPAAPSPIASPLPIPVAPSPVAVAPAPTPESAPVWPWIVGALGLAVVVGLLWARLRAKAPAEMDEPAPLEIPQSAEPDTARPWLALTLEPRRGGLNLLSATIEAELVVTNSGDRPAEDIKLDVTMLSAGSGQDARLGVLFAQPVARPVVPPFTLQPGEERRVRVIPALPRDAMEPLSAGGRAMFVPVVAINATYRWDGGVGQTAASHIVGIARPGHDKLAPFWLDQPPRMHEQLAARPHTMAFRR